MGQTKPRRKAEAGSVRIYGLSSMQTCKVLETAGKLCRMRPGRLPRRVCMLAPRDGDDMLTGARFSRGCDLNFCASSVDLKPRRGGRDEAREQTMRWAGILRARARSLSLPCPWLAYQRTRARRPSSNSSPHHAIPRCAAKNWRSSVFEGDSHASCDAAGRRAA